MLSYNVIVRVSSTGLTLLPLQILRTSNNQYSLPLAISLQISDLRMIRTTAEPMIRTNAELMPFGMGSLVELMLIGMGSFSELVHGFFLRACGTSSG